LTIREARAFRATAWQLDSARWPNRGSIGVDNGNMNCKNARSPSSTTRLRIPVAAAAQHDWSGSLGTISATCVLREMSTRRDMRVPRPDSSPLFGLAATSGELFGVGAHPCVDRIDGRHGGTETRRRSSSLRSEQCRADDAGLLLAEDGDRGAVNARA
jgi:hypothetical protein